MSELSHGDGLANDLTNHMVRGLVDRFLEYGYLTYLVKLSDRNEPLWQHQWLEGLDILRVKTVEGHIEFRFSNSSEIGISYSIACAIDLHLRVTEVAIMTVCGTPSDAATHFHNILRRIISTVDDMGNTRRPVKQG